MKKTLLLGLAALIALAALPVLLPDGTPAASTKLDLMRPDEEEPKPEHPGEAAAHWASLHETRGTETAAQLNWDAKLEIERSRLTEGASNLPNFRFEEWGPGNFAGRLRGIVIHPTDPDDMLIGSVSGGIWKTTDAGESWVPIDDFLPTLAVGSMLVDPANADTVYVGTGEGFFNVDSAQGLGIFQSTDFGDSWTQLASTNNADFFYVNRIGITGDGSILAATRTGIHRSTNGGTSWSEVSGFATSSRGFVDLQVDPSSTSRAYAYHYGGGNASRRLLRTTDHGANWTVLDDTEGLPITDISRMEIGIGSDGVVYLAVSNTNTATRGLWRSPAGGNAFVKTASNTAFIERQGWYDLICAVDPSDSDTVYMSAVDMFETNNAGATITKKTFWNPGPGQIPDYVHADQHVLTFHPSDSDTFFIGSDGGIFKTTDNGETFVSLNNNIRVTQYYGIAAHPDGELVTGGTQDNGSHVFFGDNKLWLQWFGGDGGFSAWDQQQPTFIYGSLPGGGLFGSSDTGSTSAQITLPNTTGAAFINPFTIDQNNGNRMIVGTDNIFYSANIRQLAGATWSSASPALGGSVSATTISPLDGAVAYGGTSTGRVWETTGLGSGGAFARIDTGLPTGSDVTWIEVDENDATGDTLYVTFADYGTDRIWKTTNGGTNWTSIHGNLPDIPLFAVTVDPENPDRLFLGSELGLWATESNTEGPAPPGGFTWEQYDYGPAFTRVVQLRWAADGDVLWIGTHGRSIYRARRSPATVTLGAVLDAGCDTDGYLDLGETATIPITVTNDGGQDLSAVTVSVSPGTPGLSVLTGAQSYGSLLPGESATQSFNVELVSIAGCLSTAAIEVTVDYGTDSSTETFQLTIGADPNVMTGTLSEDAEDAMTPFTHEAAVGTDDWQTTTSQSNSGAASWFAADVPSFQDKSLLTPWMEVGAAGAVTMTFALRYDMEGDVSQFWDGAVLEIRTEGGEWVDIGNTGTVPYDGPLFTNNTIENREAWSGTQTTWRTSTVDLTAYNGQTVQVRFRVVCDTAAANAGGGFWVDDIAITNVTWLDSLSCDEFGCNEIFVDGFESGNTSAWSATVP